MHIEVGNMQLEYRIPARLAQSVERLALNQVVVGSSPTVGDPFCNFVFYKQLINNLI